MSLLDTQLIVERRLAAGLSPIDLANALGVSTMMIRNLEQGTNHPKLTWQRTELLAETLGVPLAELIRHTENTAEVPGPPTPDDLRAEAALSLINKRLHPAQLADAFGWSTQRAASALKTLRERRRSTAVNVTYTGGRYGLSPRPGILTREELRALKRSAVARNRISTTDAQLLKEAVDHREHGWIGRATRAQRPALAGLINLGWVEHRRGRYYPTPEVMLSLGISINRPPVTLGGNAASTAIDTSPGRSRTLGRSPGLQRQRRQSGPSTGKLKQ